MVSIFLIFTASLFRNYYFCYINSSLMNWFMVMPLGILPEGFFIAKNQII